MRDIDTILKGLKKDLKAALGEKIGNLILFGSYSRGDNTEYSDVDLLILVNSRLTRDETRKVDDLIADYSLEHDVVISGLVYPIDTYQRFNTPFLLNIEYGDPLPEGIVPEERILETSRDFAARHPISVSDSVLSARAEEDDRL